MPLWLDMLRTPMAAPENRALRRLRLIWQALCLSLGASILSLHPLQRQFGRTAAAAIAVLLVAVVATTALYLVRKQRADTGFLDAIGEEL